MTSEVVETVPPFREGFLCGKSRISNNILTKFEHASIIGIRAARIQRGDVVSSEIVGDLSDPYAIAEEELRQQKTPLFIIRTLPTGEREIWSVRELKQI